MASKQESIAVTEDLGQSFAPSPLGTIIIEAANFGAFFKSLARHGYRVIGPTVRNRALIYEELHSPEQLPRGWTDTQGPGEYRLAQRDDPRFFDYNVGVHSWKRFLHLPDVTLWKARREGGEINVLAEEVSAQKVAFLGVRACELNAIAIQDRILLNDRFRDPIYEKHRAASLVVAVNCSKAAPTCFCPSMNTGPRVTNGFDLSLTELAEPGRHYFVVEVGSAKGAEIVADLQAQATTDKEMASAQQQGRHVSDQITRRLSTEGLATILGQSLDHPQWDKVAQRCMTCGNCTMVCPTCFCTTVEDTTDLTAQHAERKRRWDSCFTVDFSYIHGGSIRTSTASRYRQWLTHKFSSWHSQFGTSGCVGCGRCITWCPAGIDVTEEIRAIVEDHAPAPAPSEEE